MRSTTKITIANALALIAVAGCIDGFKGSNIEIDFRNRTATSGPFPVQARYGAAPAPGELPQNVQLTLYDSTNPDPLQWAKVMSFEIHRLVEPASPCFIDVGEHVPHPGLHVTQYANKIGQDTGIADVSNPPPGATDDEKIEMATAVQRMINVAKLGVDLPASAGTVGMRAVTSASATAYPPVAAAGDCVGSPDLIPPSTCIDDEVSNPRRLRLCQAAWDADPNLWEGTDRVLTAPLNGATHGYVDGVNAVNLAPVDGAGWFLANPLVNVKSFAIYYKADGDTSPGPGTRLVGTIPQIPASSPTRGVTRVTMVGAPLVMGDPATVALMSIFTNLDGDSVNF